MTTTIQGPGRSRAAYQAERRTHSVFLTFKDVSEKARFRQHAEAAGYVSFNAYLLQQLHNASSGAVVPAEYVEGLRKEVEKLRSWLDQAREENSELRKDVKALQAANDVATWIVLDLPGGAERLAATRKGVPA